MVTWHNSEDQVQFWLAETWVPYANKIEKLNLQIEEYKLWRIEGSTTE